MIYTSYFAKLKDLEKNNIIPISICGKAPDWYTGLQYKKVAPKWSFFKQWKENHDNDFYIEHFNKEVLNPLRQQDVLNDLFLLLPKETQQLLSNFNCPWYINPDVHIALICYEKPGDFCHRHLVADWLNNYGKTINIQEFNFN